jgi:hypothetical protein
MTTAGDRLRQLAGSSGAAGALLLMIGSGATSGAALVNYSGLLDSSAAAHLLADHAASPAPTLGGHGLYAEPTRRLRARIRRDEELIVFKGVV